MEHILRTQHGAFCEACGAHLGIEEDDADKCGCCGGHGLGDEDDDAPFCDENWFEDSDMGAR